MKYLIPILALIAGFVGGVWISGDTHTEQVQAMKTHICPMHPTVVSDKPGSCPICGMDLVQKEMNGGHRHDAQMEHETYICPMHSTVVSDKPGSCPICNMDLVEKEVTGSSEGEATVQIDPATIQNIGVKTMVVAKQPLTRTVRAVGRVDYDETRIMDVNSKIAGWVEELYVDYTGQWVKKGQPLLALYSPELVAAQEEYLTALDYAERMRGGVDRDVAQGADDLLVAARQRLLYWDISAGQIAELEKTRQVGRTMPILAPRSGIVTHKDVLEGAYIRSGQHLYRIADLSVVWIYADVYEYEMPWISKGQRVEVSLSYLPGEQFEGKVDYIFPFMNEKTRTVQVRMVFDNADGALKPDMYADVVIRPEVAREGIVIPVQAVIHSGTRRVVVMAQGDGRFEPREIHTGVETEDGYEVLRGLNPGEQIVTSAQFLIDSESNLKAALAGMHGDVGGHGGHGGH